MRLVCAQLREIIFESTHHLWMDVDSEEESTSFNGRDSTSMSARRMRHMLATFPKLRSLRLFGLRLTYQALIQGRNGTAANPRYVCNLLQEAECAQHLECLELLAVSSSHTVSGEWGASAPPSYSIHTDIQLEQLRKLTVEGYFTHREHPLVQSLLRASHQITHLNITGCIHFNDYDLEEAIMKPLIGTLTHLNLTESRMQHPIIHSKILETLILRRCAGFYALDPESFCPSLDVLDISSCPLFNGEGMLDVESGLANICPRLRTLNMSNCKELAFIRIKTPISTKAEINVGDSGQKVSATPPLDILSDSMVSSRLEDIDLSKCVNLSNASISCPLKRINLRECFQLKVLSISAPDLEVLDLSCLPLMLISLYCRSLVHLNLAKCRELDSKHSIIKCESLKSVDVREATYMTSEFFRNQSKK